MIDICDFAVGLSRQLYGLTIASERPSHRMMETWHPLGPCRSHHGVQFPGRGLGLERGARLVCGDAVVWKPSEKTPLSALAAMKAFERAAKRFGPEAPDGLAQLVIGGAAIGEALVASRDVPIVSATGSTRMGAVVGPKVAARFGRAILELGGNNAMIVAPSADLDMAVRAILFSAVGTAGQRCTSLRRLIVHRSIRGELTRQLVRAYVSLPIGDPRESATLVGPLIDHAARDRMTTALARAKAEGEIVHGGGTATGRAPNGGAYVEPAIVEMPGQTETVRENPRADSLHARLRCPGGGDRHPERRAPGPVVVHLHPRSPRSGSLPFRGRLRLRHRQRQHRSVGRESAAPSAARRRPAADGERLRRLEELHAPADEHGELFGEAASGAGGEFRGVSARATLGRGNSLDGLLSVATSGLRSPPALLRHPGTVKFQSGH